MKNIPISCPTFTCVNDLVHQTTSHQTNVFVLPDELRFKNWPCASNLCKLAEFNYQDFWGTLLWIAIFMANDFSERESIFPKPLVEIAVFKNFLSSTSPAAIPSLSSGDVA